MAAVAELASDVCTIAACQALCMPRASYYRDGRKTSSPAASASRPSPARALCPAEQDAVLARLHEERFQDRSPAAVYATSLDEASITARFAPCIACSTNTARFASAAIS
jgi:putative transposase